MAATELPLAQMVLAAGAVGTAAFGIVDGFKWFKRVATIGYPQIAKALGPNVMQSFAIAYGTQFQELIQGQYIDGRSKGDLPRTLRQGVRLGLSHENAAALAGDIGFRDGDRLQEIARKVEAGIQLESDEKNILGRFELAIDARIDSGLALAENKYRGSMRVAASIIAIGIALLAARLITPEGGTTEWVLALIVGVAAVPLAPIAKDVATALNSAAQAIRAK